MFAVRIHQIRTLAKDIKSFELVKPNGEVLPHFLPGSHIDVETPFGIKQYSLCGNSNNRHSYLFASLRNHEGRGGSIYLHDRLKNGDLVKISEPRNNFLFDEENGYAIFIAGGIGITPFISMILRMVDLQKSFELHYCVRSYAQLAFIEVLERIIPARKLFLHVGNNTFNFKKEFAQIKAQAKIYCCGPASMLASFQSATSHWPQDKIVVENFTPISSAAENENTSFQVKIKSTGQIIEVSNQETILQALRKNNLKIPKTQCETGICGSCRTAYSEGKVEHRDQVLTTSEREYELTICCSRSTSALLVVDLPLHQQAQESAS